MCCFSCSRSSGSDTTLSTLWCNVHTTNGFVLKFKYWYVCVGFLYTLTFRFKHDHVWLLCHCGARPLKCFISLVNENFSCFFISTNFLFLFVIIFCCGCCQYFHLPITATARHCTFFGGIICGPPWGSVAVQFGDHLRSQDHLWCCTLPMFIPWGCKLLESIFSHIWYMKCVRERTGRSPTSCLFMKYTAFLDRQAGRRQGTRRKFRIRSAFFENLETSQLPDRMPVFF